MSEEKMYMVKNRSGEFWDFSDGFGFWTLAISECPITPSKEQAEQVANEHDGHVVALIEEPKKVKLPKKAAEWVDSVKSSGRDITDIFTEYLMPDEVSYWLFDDDDEAEHREERGLMLVNAYQYGYTMEKEKKYNVKVPHADYKWYLKTPDGKLDTIFVEGLSKGFGGYPDGIELTNDDIEKFGLQDCEKEEVTDDEQ
jgi:hypothetical protein